MDKVLKRKAQDLLSSLIYLDMSQEDLAIVVEYETEEYKPKVCEMFQKGMSVEEIKDGIHDWWSDYRIADGTEDKLCEFVDVVLSNEFSLDTKISVATERSAETRGKETGKEDFVME